MKKPGPGGRVFFACRYVSGFISSCPFRSSLFVARMLCRKGTDSCAMRRRAKEIQEHSSQPEVVSRALGGMVTPFAVPPLFFKLFAMSRALAILKDVFSYHAFRGRQGEII